MEKYITICLSLLVFYTQAQTSADCNMNAPTLSQVGGYYGLMPIGNGANPNEINGAASCLGGEQNSHWFYFEVCQSGDLCITITPDSFNRDLDFAVYNLTNDSCSSIYANITLEVTCNWNPAHGQTGFNGDSGSAFEPCLPVLAGERYVLYISNFQGYSGHYSIEVEPTSSAIIGDTSLIILEANDTISCFDSLLILSSNIHIDTNLLNTSTISVLGGNFVIDSIVPSNPYLWTADSFYIYYSTASFSSQNLSLVWEPPYLSCNQGNQDTIPLFLSCSFPVGSETLLNSKSTFGIYPNPAYQVLNILSGVLESYDFLLLDIKGEVMIEKCCISGNLKLFLPDLLPGIYFVQFKGVEAVENYRLIIE